MRGGDGGLETAAIFAARRMGDILSMLMSSQRDTVARLPGSEFARCVARLPGYDETGLRVLYAQRLLAERDNVTFNGVAARAVALAPAQMLAELRDLWLRDAATQSPDSEDSNAVIHVSPGGSSDDEDRGDDNDACPGWVLVTGLIAVLMLIGLVVGDPWALFR